jgi:predicted AlkP superfamily pyrophosphatase or phosphodiesterase
VERRAILVSFDALNETRVRSTLPAESIPTFLSFFDQASCADGARPMWPSVTAASHAAIWTGVYGDVNGVVAAHMTRTSISHPPFDRKLMPAEYEARGMPGPPEGG